MHSHFGLQEQDLLAAPLIVREATAIKSGVQEVVILLQDFSWTSPQALYEALRKPKPEMTMASGGMNTPNMNMGGGAMNMPGMSMSKPDLNDITYDAFLANDRTLGDPQVIDVGRNAEVRLRIINGASSTNFMIDLGPLTGTLTIPTSTTPISTLLTGYGSPDPGLARQCRDGDFLHLILAPLRLGGEAAEAGDFVA